MLVLRRAILNRTAAILIVPVILLAASSLHYPFDFTTVDPAAGARTFQERCSACHSLERSARSTMGPGLHDVGAVAGTRREGVSAEQYLLESIVDPGGFKAPDELSTMPANVARDLDDGSVRNLIAFLMTHGARPDYREILSLNLDDRPAAPPDGGRSFSFDAAERGKAIFTGKGECSSCHSLTAYPGHDLRAPSLLNIGSLYVAEELERAIADPNGTIRAGYRQSSLITTTGEYHYGRVLNDSGDRVCLLVERQPRWFPRGDVADLVGSDTSPMPSYQDVLRDDEIRDVVAFLTTLRSPAN